MTRLEVIKANKKNYAELVERIKTLEGIEKLVAETFTAEWCKSNNWLGGLSDSKANKIFARIKHMGYSFDELYDEFERQTEWFY